MATEIGPKGQVHCACGRSYNGELGACDSCGKKNPNGGKTLRKFAASRRDKSKKKRSR